MEINWDALDWVFAWIIIILVVWLVTSHAKRKDHFQQAVARINTFTAQIRDLRLESDEPAPLMHHRAVYEITNGIRMEKLFEGHGFEICIWYFAAGSTLQRHKHENNAQIFIPILGTLELFFFPSMDPKEPHDRKKTLCRGGKCPDFTDLVGYVRPNQPHAWNALTAGEILSITIPPSGDFPSYLEREWFGYGPDTKDTRK